MVHLSICITYLKCGTIKRILLLAVLALALTSCGRFNPSLSMPDPTGHDVPYPRDPDFDFQQYVEFADRLAKQWDSQGMLYSISRSTPCSTISLTAKQHMLFRYWRPVQFWFGRRIEWHEVVILPDEPMAWIRIWTSPSTSWDKPTIDPGALAVAYPAALRLALEQGGSEYIARHLGCYLDMNLQANKWTFNFVLPESATDADALRICIDGVTGQRCEATSN